MDKNKAYRLVRDAIARGELVRPPCCSRCGCADTKPVSGRHTIQAHHHRGYAKPLDVEWLCPACHRAETPLPDVMGKPVFGEQNGAAKLTPAQVAEIRSSPLGCKRLSRIHGVNKSTIQRARLGETWAAATPQTEAEEGA